jgi:hypothetical protein
MSGDVLAGGEQGLLSLAFSPDYSTNGYFFVYYNNKAGDLEISRYKVSSSPNIANAASKQHLLTINHPTFGNHNGGKLNFGSDGKLYIATGDGGSGDDPSNNAQNGNSLLGKMLRLAVNDSTDDAPFYLSPTDNPYTDDPAVRDEIFSLGLRNPFRWTFDRTGTGPWDIWIGDVGQGAWEEVDYFAAGIRKSNYGWRCLEGNHDNPRVADCLPANYIAPAFEYDHSDETGGLAVTGGMVYRGTDFPLLNGWYVTSDYYTGNGWVIKREADGSFTSHMQSNFPKAISVYASDESGELFALSYNGTIHQVMFAGLLPASLEVFTAIQREKNHVISWKTVFEHNIQNFVVELSTDGNTFKRLGVVKANNNAAGSQYSVNTLIPFSSDVYYRLKTTDIDGSYSYSNVVHLRGRTDLAAFVSPTFVHHEPVKIVMRRPFNRMYLLDMNGRTVLSTNIPNDKKELTLHLSGLPKQVYLLKLESHQEHFQQKIIIR